MDLRARFGGALSALFLFAAVPASAQEPAAPGSTPSTPPPSAAAAPLRLTDPTAVRIERLPPENPFGVNAESPAALPQKPAFTEQIVEGALYAGVRVDRTGKVLASKRVRDPIPSLAADTKKSFERWLFEPARKSGQTV
ncbi:MAG: hypothetical protein M3R62_04045, partial [Acidobacteriota bacterium]|nr:hypothetical protein [Acidobacteriota bacterium]